MPIYEYSCPECGNQFELMRPFSDADEPAACPRCGAAGQKLMSLFGSTVDKYTLKVPAKEPFRPAAKSSKSPGSKTAIKTTPRKKPAKK